LLADFREAKGYRMAERSYLLQKNPFHSGPGFLAARRLHGLTRFRKERFISKLGKRQLLVLVGGLSLLLSLTVGMFHGIPQPVIHDEFGHLLVADTIAAGRLTNPRHPMWEHFETFHVFHSPTYQAKYPAGEGVFLALGKVVADLPILGVWLSLALAYSATCWMLLPLFSRRWSLYGSLLALANPHILFWWGQSYWGGAVAMLGGALLFGSAFRLLRRVSLGDTLLLGLGLVILANSRPYEGATATLAALPLIIAGILRHVINGQGKNIARKFVLPLLGIGILLAGWLLFYNYHLTGDPFRWPYYNWDSKLSNIELIRSWDGSEPLPLIHKILRPWYVFITPILSPFILGLAFCLKDKKVLFSLAVVALVMGVSIGWTKAWTHYMAPVYSLIVALIVYGLRALGSLKVHDLRAGRVAVLFICTAYFVTSGWLITERLQRGRSLDGYPTRRGVPEILQDGDRKDLLALFLGMVIYDGPPREWGQVRSMVARKLEKQAPKNLVIVQYGLCHNIHHEWIFNAADIDRAKIVWARDLGPDKNKQLLDYFSDRKAWILLADESPPRLLPYFDRPLARGGKSSGDKAEAGGCAA
jgi:hypothetical protein